MIITKLMGGLGNQMFQYALGRRLSLQHGVPLKLDTTFLGADRPDTTARAFALGHFALTAEPASVQEIAALQRPPARGLRRSLRRLGDALRPVASRTSLRERGAQFDPSVLRAGPRVHLEGYWQSPRYFETIGDRLRQDFELREPPAGDNAALLERIRGCEAVAVHVRRGDYASDPIVARVHGACGLDYYARALKAVAERVTAPNFFLFSDDPEWVRANLKVDGPATCVGHNGPHAHEDLRLMRACRHFVIANSSFSWWGAWLSDAPGKTVIAPQRWALAPEMNVDSRFPAGWIRL